MKASWPVTPKWKKGTEGYKMYPREAHKRDSPMNLTKLNDQLRRKGGGKNVSQRVNRQNCNEGRRKKKKKKGTQRIGSEPEGKKAGWALMRKEKGWLGAARQL